MKNQVNSNVASLIKKIFTPAALAFVLMGSSIPATAAEEKPAFKTPVEVTFLGKVESQPVFQIDIDNIKASNFYVTLKDEEGSILYSEQFRDRKYSKKFKFLYLNGNNMKVTFTLTSKDEKPQVMKFENTITTVEDVVVTKVN